MNDNKFVPSRQVLLEAERSNRINGHENLGFLSEAYGFLPIQEPLAALPPSHRAWDEVAALLPHAYQTATVRRTLEALPLLDATEDFLPDLYVLRAATILGMFAHCYYWLEPNPPATFPPTIMKPWKQISRRLNKPTPFFSYAELVLYNWQYADPANPERSLENLKMLIQSVGKREEQIFYLTMVEMAAVSTPIIGAVVRAQEAIVNSDIHALLSELELIIPCAEKVNYAFMKIDPNPMSPTYVDPAVWGRCVAPLLVPWDSYGVKGPSGTASPYFHLMDNILERKQYDSTHGQNQVHYRRIYNMQHVQNFLIAVEAISIRDFVVKSGNRQLKSAFYQLMQTYAGEKGLLGIHQRKAYGYTTTVFKVGRTETTAGSASSCPFVERTWNEINQGLLDSWYERDLTTGFEPLKVNVASAEACNVRASMTNLSLDIKDAGIKYQPGDRCAILPENSPELIAKTLKALQASQDDTIELTKAWRAVLQMRSDKSSNLEKIPLKIFLKYGAIRPLTRTIAQKLFTLTALPALKEIIDLHQEDQWELWDILELIAPDYDVKRLWKSPAWQQENLCNIVPSDQFREYSIASADSDRLDLTIATLKYTTIQQDGSKCPRHGTTSTFVSSLAHSPELANKEMTISIVRTFGFNLPADSSTPIVMFAGGSGISVFRAFIQDIMGRKLKTPCWLFYAVATSEELCYLDELAQWAATDNVRIEIVLSRENSSIQYDRDLGQFISIPATGRRLSDRLIEEPLAKRLWQMLQSKELGGEAAALYICGSGRFYDGVFSSLLKISNRFLGDSRQAQMMMQRLIAEKRLMQDISTLFKPHASVLQGKYRFFDLSEVALHTKPDKSVWIVISDEVYDLTDYALLHPGGDKILMGYAGVDATEAYELVQHHLDPSVTAMLAIYKIGAVREIDFGQQWGISLGPKGVDYISLREFHQQWASFLHLIIEMTNAQAMECSFLHDHVFNLDPDRHALFCMHGLSKLLHDFMAYYIEGLTGKKFQLLWQSIVGLGLPEENTYVMRNHVAAIKELPEYKSLYHFIGSLMHGSAQIAPQELSSFFAAVELYNRQFLDKCKMTILQGLKLFEQHERKTIEVAADKLAALLREHAAHVKDYIVYFPQRNL